MITIIKSLLGLIETIFKLLGTTDEEKQQIAKNVEGLKASLDKAAKEPKNRAKLWRVLARIVLIPVVVIYAIWKSDTVSAFITSMFGKYTALADCLWEILPHVLGAFMFVFAIGATFLMCLYMTGYKAAYDKLKGPVLFLMQLSIEIAAVTFAAAYLLCLATGDISPILAIMKFLFLPNSFKWQMLAFSMYISSICMFIYMTCIELPKGVKEIVGYIRAQRQRKKKEKAN